MSLKEKTIRGLSWAFLDRFAVQFIQFAFGILLARLLTPGEYGLVGMLAIFLAVADTFVVSGFGEALIRKSEPTKEDFSSVFVFNLFTALACYLLLCLFATRISAFFREPQLVNIIFVLGLSIVINAAGTVHRVPLIRQMDFKALTKISVFSTALSGVVGVAMAYSGYGVWSLVFRTISQSLTATAMIYLIARPQFGWRFHYGSFREIFRFGSNLMATRLINELFLNSYYLVIGRFFNARELGLFTRADGYKDMPSRALTNVIQSVSYPALSALKDDDQRLKSAYRRVLQATMYLTFTLMFCLAGAAEQFIVGLIGEQWVEAIPYLRLLCLVGAFYPLQYLNLNILIVKGRSDLRLYIEVIRKAFAIPVIAAGIFYGITAMIQGMIVISLLDYYLNASWSGKLIGYPVREQVGHIMPCLLFGAVLGVIVFATGEAMAVHPLVELAVQILSGLGAALLIANLLKLEPYLEMKAIVFRKMGLTNA